MTWTYHIDAATGLRLAVVIVLMLTIPGWTLLGLTSQWRDWPVLRRWVIAIGISIAVYPVLFYGARWLRLGRWELTIGLIVCGLAALWLWRGHWREQFCFAGREWLALSVFGATLFTRFWIIRDLPYPASPDSLHHALITQLTAAGGRLPETLAPYFPISLAMYHLGFHALAATAQSLAQAPAHTAVLWIAQVLNGLCGLGTYYVLDAKVGRLGAIIGAITAGLLSFQPAILVSWGRFTPVASQAILLMAWWVFWRALEMWRQPVRQWRDLVWTTAVAALMIAAVFELHFRVAGYFLPLLVISFIWEGVLAMRSGRARPLALGALLIGAGALALVFPVLLEALQAYLQYTQSLLSPERRQAADEMVASFYSYSWSSIVGLGARAWLLGLTLMSGCLGVLRRNRIAVTALAWILMLWLLGTAYMLEVPLLRFTTMAAVLLALYLPISLIVGVGAEEVANLTRPAWRPAVVYGLLAIFVAGGGIAGRARAIEILPHYHFVKPADIPAMNWISANTPPDAYFAVNTFFYSPEHIYGIDAGYWIPYFTGRKTTAGTMLFTLADTDYRSELIAMSRAARQLEDDNAALEDLRRLGIKYIYIGIGQPGNFGSPGLNVDRLLQAPEVAVVYQADGVTILRILP